MNPGVDPDDEVLDVAGADDWADADSIIERIREAEEQDAEDFIREHGDDA